MTTPPVPAKSSSCAHDGHCLSSKWSTNTVLAAETQRRQAGYLPHALGAILHSDANSTLQLIIRCCRWSVVGTQEHPEKSRSSLTCCPFINGISKRISRRSDPRCWKTDFPYRRSQPQNEANPIWHSRQHLDQGLLPQGLPFLHRQRRVDVGVSLPLVRHGVVPRTHDSHDVLLLQVPHHLPLCARQLSAFFCGHPSLAPTGGLRFGSSNGVWEGWYRVSRDGEHQKYRQNLFRCFP